MRLPVGRWQFAAKSEEAQDCHGECRAAEQHQFEVNSPGWLELRLRVGGPSPHPKQFPFQVPGRLPPFVGILGKALQDESLQCGRCDWDELAHAAGLVLHDCRDHTDRRRSPKRPLPRRHLVQHAPQSPNIAPSVGPLPF